MKKKRRVLFFSVASIALCGIIYELLISVVASYVLGDSILYFSLTIGLFLFFMGVGSYLSRFFSNENILSSFIYVETVIALAGGLSATVLFMLHAFGSFFFVGYLSLVAIIGICTGLEIPLVTRILDQRKEKESELSGVLTFDYLGALVGAIIFPLVLLPVLGLQVTAIIIGIVNATIALVSLKVLLKGEDVLRLKVLVALTIMILLAVLAVQSPLERLINNRIFQGEVILHERSLYQDIVFTQTKAGNINLYLNRKLQFSTLDEHRYHEAIVHVPVSLYGMPEEVLIIGGGDGLALREILKYDSVQQVTMIDLDKQLINMMQEDSRLRDITDGAYSDPRVKLIFGDAFVEVQKLQQSFDMVIIDLPDPYTPALGKMYTKEFYGYIGRVLDEEGIIVTQASSPYLARESFWNTVGTLESEYDFVTPYNIFMPTFGTWGFVLASNNPPAPSDVEIPDDLRYFSQVIMNSLLLFDNDMSRISSPINRLTNQINVQLYQDSFKQWD